MNRSKEIKIGVIVSLGIVLLVWGFNFLKGTDILSSERKFYSVYPRVDGLMEGNLVMINGFKVGRVDQLNLMADDPGRIVAKFSVKKELNIPIGTVARIVSADLMQTKAIELFLADTNIYAQNGDTLTHEVQEGLSQMVSAEILPLKRAAEELLGGLDSLVRVVRLVLNPNVREDLTKSFGSIQATLQNFATASAKLDTLISSEKTRLSNMLVHVESITSNLMSKNKEVSKIINNASAISDTLAKANITEVLLNATESLKKTSIILDKVNNGDGTLGLLLANDSLYINLSSTSSNLNKLIADIKANPRRYTPKIGLINFGK